MELQTWDFTNVVKLYMKIITGRETQMELFFLLVKYNALILITQA